MRICSSPSGISVRLARMRAVAPIHATSPKPVKGQTAPELEQPARPSEVLRYLLNVSSTKGYIDAQLMFDKGGLPVVRIEPRDPVSALLLRAQAQAVTRKHGSARQFRYVFCFVGVPDGI
jgi:hypothetical protein